MLAKQKISNNTKLFLSHSRSKYPIIGGAMYPCSNPELVAAVSNAGGIGIVQPISLTYAYNYSFEDGIKKILALTNNKPVGINIIVKNATKHYQKTMEKWTEIAFNYGIRFFVTSLGDPKWLCDLLDNLAKSSPVNDLASSIKKAYVYHDVTNSFFAKKAIKAGVDGLIAVNNCAGGHAGKLSIVDLYNELSEFNVPIVAAGGVSDHNDYKNSFNLGYCAVQMGTRFIASQECSADASYKQAIVKAKKQDIVLSEKITGVPVSVIKNEYTDQVGLKANFFVKLLLKNSKTKKLMSNILAMKSLRSLAKNNNHKNSCKKQSIYKNYMQAGKSVENIHSILRVEEIIKNITGDF